MENNLDKLFKSKLGELEPEFHPAAWDRMEGLLDDAGMMPAQKKEPNNRRRFYLLFFILGILISAIGFYSIESKNVISEGSTPTDSAESNLSISSNTEATTTSDNEHLIVENVNTDLDETELTDLSSTQSKISLPQNTDIKKSDLTSQNNNEIEYDEKHLGEIKNETTIAKNETIVTKNRGNVSSTLNNRNTTHNDFIAKNLGSVQSHVGIAKDNTSIQKEDQVSIPNSVLESDDLIINSGVFQTKELLPLLNSLKTKSALLATSNSLTIPQIQKMKLSIFEIGIQTIIRHNEGFGYSVGPYFSYNIGNGFNINFGGQFDVQNFQTGPELSVYDKVYSFGSELIERKFSLSSQKSLRIPLTLRKSFGSFILSSGVMLNKVFASQGDVSSEGGSNIENGVVIDNEMIQPMTLSFQLGGSIGLTRHFDFDFGIEYKPKAFETDLSISNDQNKIYPTLGLRYKLFKF